MTRFMSLSRSDMGPDLSAVFAGVGAASVAVGPASAALGFVTPLVPFAPVVGSVFWRARSFCLLHPAATQVLTSAIPTMLRKCPVIGFTPPLAAQAGASPCKPDT